MLTLNLHNLLNDKGIERHNLFLQKLGIGRTTASNILNSNFAFIKIPHISRICLALNCTPSELFVWNENPNEPLPEGHALQKIKKKDTKPLAGRIRNLTSDQVNQLNSFLDDLEKKINNTP